MNRNQLKLGITFGISVILLAASVAQAASNNPLDPSYYSHKVKITHSQSVAGGMPYSDSQNPLHPSFAWTGNSKWETTVAAEGKPYVDRTNPLHPSYQKNQ